ncbi:MAG: alpha/beta hydrolase [Chloroflexota bacterium]|nr:alpha/beta hydrolase [Chloroflexota bacterium]
MTMAPTEHWANVRDLRMRYLDWNGDGPPILALHGLASSAHWYDIVAPLLRDRYRIVAPDQRGHGQTTQASNGYGWHSVASDAVGLLDLLGIEKAIVFGHSWGGNVAVATAAHYPERVAALVMIDGGFFSPQMIPGATWEAFSQRLSPRDVSGTRAEFIARMQGQLAMCWNDEIERIVQTMVYEEGGQIYDILRPQNQAQVIRAMWDDPASDAWCRIKCPSIIVPAGPSPDRANSDFAVSRRRMVNLAAENIPNCRVHWIPETVHDIGYHKPRELADAILAFLDDIG